MTGSLRSAGTGRRLPEPPPPVNPFLAGYPRRSPGRGKRGPYRPPFLWNRHFFTGLFCPFFTGVFRISCFRALYARKTDIQGEKPACLQQCGQEIAQVTWPRGRQTRKRPRVPAAGSRPVILPGIPVRVKTPNGAKLGLVFPQTPGNLPAGFGHFPAGFSGIAVYGPKNAEKTGIREENRPVYSSLRRGSPR